jgi:hypothetical protein
VAVLAVVVAPPFCTALPSFGPWLTALVPVNPIKSAADGAMLPLIVFSVAFGIAVTRVDASRRAALVDYPRRRAGCLAARRLPRRVFARAALSAQAMAFSGCSSLAARPAMIADMFRRHPRPAPDGAPRSRKWQPHSRKMENRVRWGGACRAATKPRSPARRVESRAIY